MSRDIEMVWVDVETTGLDAEYDHLLEVGIYLTDRFGSVETYWSRLVSKSWDTLDIETIPGLVRAMHLSSGLFGDLDEEVAQGRVQSLSQVADQAVEFLEHHGATGKPMCGSSVQLDREFIREQMPDLFKAFHYRNLDVSTIKEACRVLNPSVFSKLAKSEPTHRVDACLPATIGEYQFYLDNFLWVEE